MSQNKITAIILAAGKGTRMRSPLPKVLHEIAHLSMVGHVLSLCDGIGCNERIIITGHQSDKVRSHIEEISKSKKMLSDLQGQKVSFALQEPQLGTAHAVSQANFEEITGDDVLILYADTPLISIETIQAMQEIRQKGYDMVFLGFETPYPTGYGRLITDEEGELLHIVEEKEANDEEKSVNLCNSGVVLIKKAYLAAILPQVKNNNAKGEYYLTDIVSIGREMGLKAGVGLCDHEEVMGVNSQAELSHLEMVFQTCKRLWAMENGVTLQMPQSVYFAHDTKIGAGTVIEPNVYFGKGVTIGENCHIKAFSHIEGSVIDEGCVVGPFARLRPHTHLMDDVKIGNFVETKNAIVEQGTKINHLSYIGDASLGKNVNIGAGTITCNYDGVNKHKTFIEEDAFIGSNTSLVAPVRIEKGAYVGSGSVITKDVTSLSLAITRSEQKEVKNWANKVKNKK